MAPTRVGRPGEWWPRLARMAVLALLLAGVPAAAPSAQEEGDLPAACADAEPATFADRDRIAAAHRPSVDCLWHLGVVRGSGDPGGEVYFSPHASVQRSQFAGMIHGLLDALGRAGGLDEMRSPRFADVPAEHPFDHQVHTSAHVGIVDGIDEQHFAPQRWIRRDQAASILLGATEWTTGEDLAAAGGPYFGDTSRSVFRDELETAFEFGLVQGVRRPCGGEPGEYGPSGAMQRQQAASLLVNAIGVFEEIESGGGGGRTADAECPSPVWQPTIEEAVTFADSRDNSTSFAAIGTDGRMVGHRASTQVPQASVLKVMFLVAYLRQADVRDRDLTQEDRDLLEPMIRWSANEPATEIANELGPDPMYALAEEAGMQEFSYTRPWGHSTTSARDQAAFLLEVDQYVPSRHRTYVLQLLTEIVPEQRWGIGEVETGDWTKHFKGGWGSGTGAVVHQVVLLVHPDGTRVALAVMTTSSPSHEYGTNTLRGVFRRLLDDLP